MLQEQTVGNVELRQFRYFVAVAEEAHFGKAASRLQIAQPGLSQQIKKLERSVGAQLLIRDPRGVKLTGAGRLFLEQARLTLELADRAVASARLAERGKKGLLRVGTLPLGVPPLAETILREFGERFPAVDVQLHPLFPPQLIDAIRMHSLDVAITLSPYKVVDPPPGYLQLGTFELVAVLPEGHRLAKLERVPRSELLEEPFLDWPRNVSPELIDHIHRVLFGTDEHPRSVEVLELEEAHRFLQVTNGRGFAITFVPGQIDRHVPGIVFRHIEKPTPFIGYGVTWASTQASPFAPAFLDVAREFAEASSGSDRDAVTVE